MGTPPPPTLNYFGAENFKAMTGTDITIVTYKGTGPLTNDLVGGHVMLAFNTLPPAIGNIQAGKLHAIAVAAPDRLAAHPGRADGRASPVFRASISCSITVWRRRPERRGDRRAAEQGVARRS